MNILILFGTETGNAEMVADDLADADDPLINLRSLRLTRPQARALADHLDRLVNELRPAGPAEPKYGVLVSLYRQPRASA